MSRLPAPYLGRGRRLLAWLVAVGLGQAAVTVASALLVRHVFHALARGPRGGDPLPLIGWLALAALVGGWLRARERVFAERLGQEHAFQVRAALLCHVARVPPRVLGARASSAVLLRFVGDVTALRQWVSLGIARLVVFATLMLATLSVLAILDPAIAAAVAAALLAGGVVVGLQGRALRAAAVQVRRRRSRLAALVGERLRTAAVVQVYGQGERERRRAQRRARHLRDAMVARARVSGAVQGTASATAGLAHAAALLAAVLQVRAGGGAGTGTIVAALLIAGVLAGRLPEIGRVQELRQAAAVGREKAGAFLDLPLLPAPPPGAPDLPAGPGVLELDGLRIDGVLDDAHAVAHTGEVVAVTGPNGAGKSTLLSVIAGLLPADAGTVLLDGEDLTACSADSMRAAIGIVGPDLPLLSGTVDENVRYRRRDASEQELHDIAQLCGLDEVYAALPRGAATRVGENGHGLSAGQRQRVALARALLGNPRVLLFDEADVHFDAEGRELMRRVLAEHRGCALVVTHAPEAVAADVEWRLQDGGLTEARIDPDQLGGRTGPAMTGIQRRGATVGI